MATYVIGDVHGCFDELQELLAHIAFDPAHDNLWFIGDLINRGPKNIETLRFIYALQGSARVILGNHDLHLLAVQQGLCPLRAEDNFQDVLAAHDVEELCTWLRQQSLAFYEKSHKTLLVHAGIAPGWDLTTTLACAKEVETALRDEQRFRDLLAQFYGNEPNRWQDTLAGMPRLRFIVNALTRLRYGSQDGHLLLDCKKAPGEQPAGYIPWFELPSAIPEDHCVIFGHWATLLGTIQGPRAYSLDTACYYGVALSAVRLEDKQIFRISCKRRLRSN